MEELSGARVSFCHCPATPFQGPVLALDGPDGHAVRNVLKIGKLFGHAPPVSLLSKAC